MEFGSRDSQVFPLQNFLMENGYLEMYPTGFFGRNTEFAVKEWQKRHGIDVRGWVGPNTRGSIAGLTCKTQAAYDKAFKGEIVKKYVAPAKKVLSKTPVSQPTKTIVIETTTEDNFKPVTFSNTNSGNNLSSLGATFFTKRSPVNTLYFTYKANTTLDDVYMCVSKNGSNKCETSGNFVEVKQKYEPGSIDTINNNTKWIFNVYYNPDTWGTEGGNIYIRNGIGNISEVYSVKVANTL
jgi:peptidoglycan hydrolase-like protein with peptidoglycan-binding domain